jgi:hypothetical protein
MGDPVKQLSPELLREHPALVAFSDFIQAEEWVPPGLSDIQVDAGKPQDGIILLNYVDPKAANGNIYFAELNANTRLLTLRAGKMTGKMAGNLPQLQMKPPVPPKRFDDLCRTVKALGGDREAQINCDESPQTKPPEPEKPSKIAWTTAMLGGNWPFFELGGFWGRRMMARELTRLHQSLGTKVTVPTGHLNPLRAGLLASAIVYEAAYFPLGDLLGMSENHHALERRSLALGLGYAAYRGMEALFQGYSRASGINPLKFGSVLLSTALSEALLGRTIGNDLHDQSGGRFVGHTLGFFLPQFYRIARGHRMIPLDLPGVLRNQPLSSAQAERFSWTRTRQGIGRWAGRALVAGFVVDTAYLGIQYLAKGSEASAGENQLYERATALQEQNLGKLASFAHGFADFFAPALTRHYLVSDRYVSKAREEFRSQAAQLSQNVEPVLRHALLFGSAGESLDPRFYTEVNWNALRGDNALRDIHLPNGRTLPVENVAEQLRDPEIYRRVIEGSDVESQISYIQRQFRGHRLTRSEVSEILHQIALHHARSSLGELRSQAMAAEMEQGVDAQQVLALRRAALADRIRKLQAEGPKAARDLAAYTAVGQRIGLLDAHGNFALLS